MKGNNLPCSPSSPRLLLSALQPAGITAVCAAGWCRVLLPVLCLQAGTPQHCRSAPEPLGPVGTAAVKCRHSWEENQTGFAWDWNLLSFRLARSGNHRTLQLRTSAGFTGPVFHYNSLRWSLCSASLLRGRGGGVAGCSPAAVGVAGWAGEAWPAGQGRCGLGRTIDHW